MAQSAAGAIDEVAAIRQVVGRDHVRAAQAEDAIDGLRPRWVVAPATPQEISRLLALADDSGLSVVARGNGTKMALGNPLRSVDIVLSTARLNSVLEHAHGDMTATVQAGCSVATFQETLSLHGQRLALDPIWQNHQPGATIGGIIATNDSGALRATFGTLRDHLIGVTVALADGTLVVLHCSPEIKHQLDVWGPAGDALPIMRRVKEQFDPRGTLSPGRFVGGI